MKPAYFFISLIAAFILATWFGHHAVRTTLPRQVLARYNPDSTPHIVFLGSSLTDAAVNQALLDSLFQADRMNLRAFNCALAEISGDAYYYLIMKNRVLARGRPAAIAIELRLFPFTDSKKAFKLLGRGTAADLTLSELMGNRDFLHVSGGFPGVLESIAFFLHKHWFLYHHRLNIQEKVAERMPFVKKRPPGPSGDERKDAAKDPYGMGSGAVEAMRSWAREGLQREQCAGAGNSARSSDGYFKDIVSLAKENGVRLIFFRPPFPPADGILRGNSVYEKSMESFQVLCDSLGIVMWDLAAAPAGTSWSFSDGIHCDPRSARIFTREIAERIRKIALVP